MTQPQTVIVENKVCRKCGEEKPITQYYKKKASTDGYEHRCKFCRHEQQKTAPSRNPEVRKFVWTKTRYGVTKQDYLQLLIKQGGHCACCPETENLVVDHCHATGEVRGLLCGPCNKGLGHFRDNTEYLTNAILYLNEPLSKTP